MRDFFFFNWFRVAIERQLPLGFFSKYGYTCTLLRMSPSDISRHASMFLTREFFNVVHEEGSSIAQKVKSSIIDKKFKSKDDETGARTIIIETQDQVESLQKLLEEFAGTAGCVKTCTTNTMFPLATIAWQCTTITTRCFVASGTKFTIIRADRLTTST